MTPNEIQDVLDKLGLADRYPVRQPFFPTLFEPELGEEGDGWTYEEASRACEHLEKHVALLKDVLAKLGHLLPPPRAVWPRWRSQYLFLSAQDELTGRARAAGTVLVHRWEATGPSGDLLASGGARDTQYGRAYCERLVEEALGLPVCPRLD